MSDFKGEQDDGDGQKYNAFADFLNDLDFDQPLAGIDDPYVDKDGGNLFGEMLRATSHASLDPNEEDEITDFLFNPDDDSTQEFEDLPEDLFSYDGPQGYKEWFNVNVRVIKNAQDRSMFLEPAFFSDYACETILGLFNSLAHDFDIKYDSHDILRINTFVTEVIYNRLGEVPPHKDKLGLRDLASDYITFRKESEMRIEVGGDIRESIFNGLADMVTALDHIVDELDELINKPQDDDFPGYAEA